MSEMSKITNENLAPFSGHEVHFSCTVGVVAHGLRGTLVVGYGFCWYGLRLSDGNTIGFSYGQFKVDNNVLFVHVS